MRKTTYFIYYSSILILGITACGGQTKENKEEKIIVDTQTISYRTTENIILPNEENGFYCDFTQDKTIGDFDSILQERRQEYLTKNQFYDSIYKNDVSLYTTDELQRAKLDLSLLCQAPDIWWWRLNQFCPIENVGTRADEVENARKIIDSIFHGTMGGSTIKNNIDAVHYAFANKKLCTYYWQKLLNKTNFKPLLQQEEIAWKKYFDAFMLRVDTVDFGREMFSGREADYYMFCSELYKERLASFVCLYHKQIHSEIPVDDRLIDSLYQTRFATIKFYDESWEASHENSMNALKQEQEMWKQWMLARNSVSNRLKGNEKSAYDMATNDLKRTRAILNYSLNHYIPMNFPEYQRATDSLIMEYARKRK